VNLYTNENFPLPAVLRLRALGHDVLTSSEAGKANQKITDEDVVWFAISKQRAVLTLNRRDFIRLHKGNDQHYGIVVCVEDLDYGRLADRIHAAVMQAGTLDQKLIEV